MSENEADPDDATVPVDEGETEAEPATESEDFVEHIEETPTEERADELADLHERAAVAEDRAAERADEIEDLESKLKRNQADFQNYKKRAEERRIEREERATEDLVSRLLDVRDNLSRALTQEEGTDIRSGIESTLEEFDRVLGEENVSPIDPEPGSVVDPQRHEVMLQVDSDQPTDTVAEVYRPGYEMGEKVLRPAQITVSE